MTDADVQESPSHLNANTPTPVPRTKVGAQLSWQHACMCASFVYALTLLGVPVMEAFCLSLSAVKRSVVVYR